MSKSSVFYRIVKAPHGHAFPGLYAVEKVILKGGVIVEREIVKEWDLRILAEAALARFGGSSAYEAYVFDNGEPEDLTGKPEPTVIAPRTTEELALNKRKLKKELTGE